MGAPNPSSILDSIESTNLGMHAGIPPHLLPHNELAFGVNITNRGGHPKTRPVFRKCTATFATDVQTPATQALFQGAYFYEGSEGNPNAIVAAIGGKLFRWIPGSAQSVAVDDISGGVQRNPTAPKNWMWQAENFLISNDGLDYPLFFDGASTRKSAGPAGQELPAGTAGSYINDRVVMVLPDQRSWVAGDLAYSRASGTPLYRYRDSVLKMTENAAILGGASFAIPINAGSINAIFAVAVPDTSLGQGSIFIGTRKGVFSAQLPLDATLWTTTQQPTQVVSLPSAGPLSPYGVALINGDAWYRAKDGLRSYQVARREFNSWVQTALSFEMQPILSTDTKSLRGDVSMVDFENRLLTTCAPQFVQGRGTTFKGIIALDFNNISSLTVRNAPPAYDGLWTGLNILQLVEGVFNDEERCFAFCLDATNDICLYEILTENSYFAADFNGEEEVSPECFIISNALFGLESYTPPAIRNMLKKLLTADLFMEQMVGTVEWNIKYRSDQMVSWRDWSDFSLCGLDKTCSLTNCSPPQTLQPLYATYKRLPMPEDDFNPVTKRLYRSGYQFQIRLAWTGKAQLRKLLAWAGPLDETAPTAPVNESCVTIAQCPEEYFSYEIE